MLNKWLEWKKQKLPGGWRKKTWLLERNGIRKVLSLVSAKDISEGKFIKAIEQEDRWNKTGLAGRKLVEWGKQGDQLWVVFGYIEGQPKWQWDKAESYELGKYLNKLHQAGLFHMDVKPGNVMWKGREINGLVDFEEVKVGNKWMINDIANTLSWIIVSGGNQEDFLRGYGMRRDRYDCARMKKLVIWYLKKRVEENQKGAFLALAKARLDGYRDRVNSKILRQKDLVDFRQKNPNKKIVFLVGAFELLHWGHLKYLKKSANRGDLLVVGVASDKSRKSLKGESFPIIGQKTRIETLAHFDIVDGVVMVDEEDIKGPLDKLRPDVLVVIKKDLADGVRKESELVMVKGWGGKVYRVDYCHPSVSSSKIIEMVAMKKIDHVLGKKSRGGPLLKVKNGDKVDKKTEVDQLTKLSERYKKEGKKIGFTSLSADLFHLGHARFVQKAKSLVDILIVGSPSNKSIERLKGKGRPIVDETARVKVLAELPYVDNVVVFDQDTVLKCLQEIKPDIFFTVKEDWNKGIFESEEAKWVRSYGGKIVLSERMAPYISASMMIDKAAGELIKKSFGKVLETANKTTVINADFDPFDPANQLAAREKGFYDKILAEVDGRCVFCDLKDKYIIDEKDGVVLTVALYPYADGHLLIIPKRHIETIDDLTDKERRAVFELKKKGMRLLSEKLGIENVWFLVREGDGVKAGKTVRHVHFHLLPYDANVIKMAQVKLKVRPIDLAKKLRR